jgi:hypothetical protein
MTNADRPDVPAHVLAGLERSAAMVGFGQGQRISVETDVIVRMVREIEEARDAAKAGPTGS